MVQRQKVLPPGGHQKRNRRAAALRGSEEEDELYSIEQGKPTHIDQAGFESAELCWVSLYTLEARVSVHGQNDLTLKALLKASLLLLCGWYHSCQP